MGVTQGKKKKEPESNYIKTIKIEKKEISVCINENKENMYLYRPRSLKAKKKNKKFNKKKETRNKKQYKTCIMNKQKCIFRREL